MKKIFLSLVLLKMESKKREHEYFKRKAIFRNGGGKIIAVFFRYGKPQAVRSGTGKLTFSCK